MMTLDALARMATRMPSELSSRSGGSPYRRGALGQRRLVHLPSIADEMRRAARIFAFVIGSAVGVIGGAGTALTSSWQHAHGQPVDVLATAGWFGVWILAVVAPITGLGLWREVARFAAVRRALGTSAWLDITGCLISLDETRRRSLRG